MLSDGAAESRSCFTSVHVSRLRPRKLHVPIICDVLRHTSKRQPMQAALQPDEEAIHSNQSTKVILFLTSFVVVPFLTYVLLNVENDSYQIARQTFNAAMATGFDPTLTSPESPEYIAMSNLYNDSMQSLFVLLLSKRLALYFIATLATLYSGYRAHEGISQIRCGAFTGPGEALDRLNNEILDGKDYLKARSSDENLSTQEYEDRGDDRDIFASMIDQDEESSSNAGKILALSLPLALTASLVASYGIIVAGKHSTALPVADDSIFYDMQVWFSSNFPYLTALPGFILCMLFVSAEFRRVFPNHRSTADDSASTKTPIVSSGNVLALLYVTGAYLAKTYPTISFGDQAATINLDLWPLQNGVNIAITTTVTRALAPILVSSSSKSIRTIALALGGITIFDGVSVFGTVANAEIDASSSQASVMEVVAKSKLALQASTSASPWQPGLLEIIVGHNNNQVAEALGLGDVVFPACLVAWALNADTFDSTTDDGNERLSASMFKYGYTLAATFGYVLASIVMEITGSFSLLGNRGGLPALVFFIPIMLLCVTAVAWRRNELTEVWGDAQEQ